MKWTIVGFVLVSTFSSVVLANSLCDREVHSDDRVDCHPELNASQERCEARGCCWQPPGLGGPLGVPMCYFPLGYPSYKMTNISLLEWGHRLTLSGPATSHWPKPISTLFMDIIYEENYRLRLKIYDATQTRYEVPIDVPKFNKYPEDRAYTVLYRSDPIGLTIKRRSTGAIIFDSTDVFAPLIYNDQFIQLTGGTGTSQLYGLGEHRGPLLRDYSDSFYSYTFWNRDIVPTPNTNLYGDHPFYMAFERDSADMHGVFLLNSNALEVVLQPAPSITFRTVGGIIDLYFFLGPTPEDVASQYASVVGYATLPPYWALGFHLCRWGYTDAPSLKEVIQRTRSSGIPYDTQWADIDYMRDHLDFTYDEDKFSELPAIINELHHSGQHFVVIIDPGIASSETPGSYPPYDRGLQQQIFIKEYGSDQPIIGKVWPGETAFPDWTNPQTENWWLQEIRDFHQKVPFDGLWVDMNEPSNFVRGSVNGCTNGTLDKPPYTPGVLDYDLSSRTLCPSSQQFLGPHYNLHNLYGLGEMNATHRALQSVLGQRPLVISRSTFSSAGRYGGHWSGDISSTWNDMAYTIPELLKFQLFGVPLMGADICGFAGNTNEELCTRWMQLGAFYLFMRNHNSIGQKDQDPGAFSKDAQSAMVNVTNMRYTLLPYLYTHFFKASTQGKPVARPLFYHFPEDRQARSIDRQFMWGSCILVNPVLESSARSVKAYFPEGRWYDAWSGNSLPGSMDHSLDAPLSHLPLYVRGGCVLPTLPPARTTTAQRDLPFVLKIYLDDEGKARGSLFWDDGVSIDVLERQKYMLVEVTCRSNSCNSTQQVAGSTSPSISDLLIIGFESMPYEVKINGIGLPFNYNAASQTISVTKITGVTFSRFFLTWN